MQTQARVSQQTRLCVLVVVVVSLMWLPVLLSLLFTPLTPGPPDLASVADTMSLCTLVCVLLSLLVFLIGEVNGNVSSVDRLWSLVPTLYTLITWSQYGGPRLALMSLVASVWSLRLTWNFWRRGGYSWPPWTGCEDYRLYWLRLSAGRRLIS